MRVRHGGDSGPEVRLAAALLTWDSPRGDMDSTRANFSGIAWRGADGGTLWGWPDERGQIQLRPGSGRPEDCCLLPAALSLALALRRSGCDLGAVTLVIGDGFRGRMARAVAATLGCRILAPESANSKDGRNESRTAVVIETTGDPDHFRVAVERCRDWGTVLSLGGALTSAPFDYYPDVHRRALTVTHVPDRPVLCPGEEEIAERCGGLLIEAVRGIRPAPDEVLDARVLPEDASGELTIERGGWGLLRVD